MYININYFLFLIRFITYITKKKFKSLIKSKFLIERYIYKCGNTTIVFKKYVNLHDNNITRNYFTTH